MRRILGGVAATVLALTAVPALAEETEPVLNAPCAPRSGAQVLTVDGATGTIETPAPPFGESGRTFVLDLAGLPVGTTGDANVVLSWGIPVNDFDLNVNGTDSLNIQPVEAPEESVAVSRVKHCSTIVATAANFLAPVIVDTLTLAVTVKARPPV